jgi:hypothetical protein
LDYQQQHPPAAFVLAKPFRPSNMTAARLKKSAALILLLALAVAIVLWFFYRPADPRPPAALPTKASEPVAANVSAVQLHADPAKQVLPPASQDLPVQAAAPVVSPTAPVTSAVPQVSEPRAAAQPVAPSTAALPVKEVAATRRMYLAHSPLREPSVADPDSTENRRILSEMVLKAIAREKSSSANPVQPASK